MTIAFLFAGQGSQKVGMGTDLVESCADCRATFEAANAALGFRLSEIMMGGPLDVLRRTAIAQPAVLTLSVAHAHHLQSLGIVPDLLAGHSLGEYSALVMAGAIEFEDAVRLVAERGRLMQETVPEGQGAMTAIVGLDRDAVYAACDAVKSIGVVNVACHNSPGQTVISGATGAVNAAAERCEEEGGGAVPLSVSAPFHCQLLAPMLPEFTRLVDDCPIQDPKLPVIDNVTAVPLHDAAAVRKSLVAQITAPVLFEESLRYLAERETRRYIQCGPDKSLLSFSQRVARGAEFFSFQEMANAVPVAG